MGNGPARTRGDSNIRQFLPALATRGAAQDIFVKEC